MSERNAAQHEVDPSIEYAGLKLDYERRVLQYRGQLMALGKKEAVLLRVLIEAQGGVVPFTAIVEEIWRETPPPASGSVRALIWRLRSKFRNANIIETIGREGYRISNGD